MAFLKKFLSSVLAATMIFTAVPASVFAAETDSNLVQDGTFDGELTYSNWDFREAGLWYAVGDYNAPVEVGGSENAVGAATGGIYQKIYLDAGKTYELSMDVYFEVVPAEAGIGLYSSTGDATQFTDKLVFGYNGQNETGSVESTLDFSSIGTWQTMSGLYSPSLSGYYFISLWGGSAGRTYIDNVSCVESDRIIVPEPLDPIDPESGYTAGSVWEPNAGNPMMPGYIGDPFLFQDDDGTFYVYGTTDGYGAAPVGTLANNSPYCVWYSKDLVNWSCKTFSYEDGTFPKTSETLWAPSVAKASDGKYYMAYIWQGYNCYLAVSDSPLGPWEDCYDGAVVTEEMFDTDIFTLSDGYTYVTTMGPQTNGKRTVYLGRFKEDMSGLDENGLVPIYNTNVFEGPGLFERDGKYYLTFSNGSLGTGSYRVDYAISDSLYGPYTSKGTILQRNGDISTTGHSNSVQIGDDWYICYHRKTQVGEYSRQACLEKMEFNADGTIKVITPSVNGTRPELELTITDENLTWGGVTATASSFGSLTALGTSAWLPEYAVDRNNGTLWSAATTGAEWFQIDLGEVKKIERVETYFEYHTVAYQYLLEYSVDGENWSEYANKLDNTDVTSPQIDKADEAVDAQYLRISFEHGVNVERDVPAGIFEMNVYAPSSKTPSDEKADKAVLLEALKAMIPESEKNRYSEETWAVYAETADSAIAVYENDTATQEEVDAAVAALTEAKATLVEAGLPYTDVVKENWFYDAVAYTYYENLMTGMNETTFGPYGELSRAQFALILYRIEGISSAETDRTFKDITGDEWYGPAVLWAAENGIVTGYQDGNFGPADMITREQMAVMMYRYTNYLKADTSEKADFSTFVDADKVSAFATEAMQWAVGSGIITGKEGGTVIDPQGNTARAEAAVIIQRYMES